MVIFDAQTIGLINVFEKVTGARVKDCFFENSTLVFVVQQGQMGLAIGRHGANIKKVSAMLKRDVKAIEFNPDPCKFVEGLLYPLRAAEIKHEESSIVIKAHDNAEKGKIFGREKTNLKRIQGIVSKYFDVVVKVE